MAARYRIVREIGRGAMGRVYLAHDDLLDRDVALKELAVPEYLDEKEKEELRERFRLEARAAARLSHPHILTVHDIISAGERQFIVMEYLEGKTLRDVLAERSLSVEEVLSMAPMIGDALHYAHSHGIVHRDIKPDNIFVLENGNVKVADFGIAKMLKVSDRTHTDVIMGTPNYIAPEMVRGMPYDHRVDIFSLGVTLYEALAGKRPFDAENDYAIIYRVAGEDPVSLLEYRDDVPMSLVHIISRALEKDPERRYKDMGEFKDDLMRVRSELGMATAPEGEERFDKREALRSELEAARGLDLQEMQASGEAAGPDFRRDREWRELIARIYHGEEDREGAERSAVGHRPVPGHGGGPGGGGPGGRSAAESSWQELERRYRTDVPPASLEHVERRLAAEAGEEAAPRSAAWRPSADLRTHPLPSTVTREGGGSGIASLGPPEALRWSGALLAAGAVLMASAMFPWIGKGLNPSRALLGITFPEGMAVAALVALAWGANALLLLGAGKSRIWEGLMRALCLLCVLLVLLFLGLRVFGGIGYQKAAGLNFAGTLAGVGWGYWLALVSSLFTYSACMHIKRHGVSPGHGT
ncbi:MAG: serine/threonine-protein kinase [Actinomycetota bacterium]|nr:serine/threonine-protein kinase [Actinomycetota bacterium]